MPLLRQLSLDSTHASFVDLDDVGLEQHETLQAAVSVTHIVDRDPQPRLAKSLHGIQQVNRVTENLLLADLDAEILARLPGKLGDEMFRRDGDHGRWKKIHVESHIL